MTQKPVIQFKVVIDEVISIEGIDLGFESVVLYNKRKY